MPYLPILTYHRLLKEEPSQAIDPKRIAVSQAQFRRHLACLRFLGYQSVRLEEFVQQLRRGQVPPARTFAITFDDGYEEVLTLGLPLLVEFGFTATVFAVPGQLGGCNVWDDGSARLMSLDQYRELRRAGITIGAHTCRHVHLTQVTLETARREIIDSKQLLERSLGEPITLFAYPYGETSAAIDQVAQDAGFEAAFATDRAPRNHAENLYRLRRVVIFPRTTMWELLWKVQRWYPGYQDWKRG